MKSSLAAESSDDDLEDRDDDADNKLDVEEEESLMAVTMAMPSSASSSYATTHSLAVEPAAAAAAVAELPPSQILSDAVCTPIGECEMCPSKWQVMMEKEEQTIKGEYESCIEFGRRMPFECTFLFQGK